MKLLKGSVYVRPGSTESLTFRIVEVANTTVKSVAFYKQCGEHAGEISSPTIITHKQLDSFKYLQPSEHLRWFRLVLRTMCWCCDLSPNSRFPRLDLYLPQGQDHLAVVLVRGTVLFSGFFTRDSWCGSFGKFQEPLNLWKAMKHVLKLEVKNLFFKMTETRSALEFRFLKKNGMCVCVCVVDTDIFGTATMSSHIVFVYNMHLIYMV